MPDLLTARDIESKRFSRAVRGYSATEVDRFLDRVAEDIQKYCIQYADLERYAARLEDKIREHEELKETLSGTLLMAQKTADAKAEAAETEAKNIIETAKSKAERLYLEAEARKERTKKEIDHFLKLRQEFKADFKALLSRFASLIEMDTIYEDEEAATEEALPS
ncbi:MAG: DivIVA domain-containing protein [Synergistaceae bacterium]|nr:DivIVA domain-containing protein [Synergistota bacterium]NLM70684.1 DivIVA domain-containing protein [Synergistaceae bacterium]